MILEEEAHQSEQVLDVDPVFVLLAGRTIPATQLCFISIGIVEF